MGGSWGVLVGFRGLGFRDCLGTNVSLVLWNLPIARRPGLYG